MINEDVPQVEQKEYIKLMKMSKGYQWEIKILAKAENNVQLANSDLIKLDDINKIMVDKYGA